MTDLKQKIVAVATVFTVLLSAAGPAMATTAAELQAQIASLTAQLAALQTQLTALTGAPVTACTFTRNLYPGMSGADVKCLQQYLNGAGYTLAASGAGSSGNETEYFGSLTQAAVKAWQDANGVAYGAYGGYFGLLSQAKYIALAAAAPAEEEEEEEEEEEAVLEGGAGSVEDYDLVSGLANEEVGEDAKDVEVAGLEMEVDVSSDIKITAVQLTFDEGTATSDFEDYADEVSVWLGSNEVARKDGDTFNDDNDWTKTVTLKGDNIIEAGETGTLYVKISGISNLDSADAGDTWTVDFTSIRFMDAQGATISEDPTVAVTTFSFETYATAAGTELKISEDDDDVNEAHVIDIHATADTDDESILSFTIEIEGDSDVNLDELVVNLDSVGVDLEDAISGLNLVMEGDQIGSESIADGASTDETITFDNLDTDLEAGETYAFLVTADFLSIADGIAAGDTVSAQISSTERDLIEAEDESGEDLVTTDMTGTAIGEAHALYDDGIQVVFTGSSLVKTSSQETGINETVEFTLTFDATAFGDDIWVDQTCVVATTGTDVDALEVSLDNDGDGSSTTCTDFDSTGDEGTDGFEVKEGQTKTFTVTILGDGGEAGTAGSSVTFKARINGIGYNVTTDAAGDTCYAFNMDEYKSSAVTIFDR